MKGDDTMAEQVKDPVCGMMVDPETTKLKSEHMGQTFHFCSPRCKAVFDREPMKFMQQDQDSGAGR